MYAQRENVAACFATVSESVVGFYVTSPLLSVLTQEALFWNLTEDRTKRQAELKLGEVCWAWSCFFEAALSNPCWTSFTSYCPQQVENCVQVKTYRGFSLSSCSSHQVFVFTRFERWVPAYANVKCVSCVCICVCVHVKKISVLEALRLRGFNVSCTRVVIGQDRCNQMFFFVSSALL